jgi:hypothetical protein
MCSYVVDVALEAHTSIAMNALTLFALWLISNIHVYLAGFLSSINRPEMRKNSQECGGKNYGRGAFTLFELTMMAAYAKYTFY